MVIPGGERIPERLAQHEGVCQQPQGAQVRGLRRHHLEKALRRMRRVRMESPARSPGLRPRLLPSAPRTRALGRPPPASAAPGHSGCPRGRWLARPEAPATACCEGPGDGRRRELPRRLLKRDPRPHRPPTAPLTARLRGRSGTAVLESRRRVREVPCPPQPVSAGTPGPSSPHHPAGAAPSSAPSSPPAPLPPCGKRKGWSSSKHSYSHDTVQGYTIDVQVVCRNPSQTPARFMCLCM